MTDLNSTSTGVVVGAGQTLNILSPGGTAIDLTNSGTVNGFRLSNSGGEVEDFANFSLMQASGTNAFLFLSGGPDLNAKGATIRALATGSGNTTTVETSHALIFNSGTIAAIGSSGANATVDFDSSTVEQSSTGRIVASGNAVVDFSTSEIEGGTLATVGSNASAGVFDPGARGGLFDATVASNTNIGAVGFLSMVDVTFGTNDTVKAYDGGTAFLSNVTPAANDKFIASGGSLAIKNDSSLVLKSGTLLLATSNGFVSATADDGALTNSVGATIEALANTIGTSARFSIRGSAGVNNGGLVAAVASGAFTFASGHVDGGSAAVNNSGSMVASGIANGLADLTIATFGSSINNKKIMEALATSNGSAFLDISARTGVTNGGTMVASATFDGFAGMEVEGSSVVNSGTFGAFANHQAFAEAEVYATTVVNTKIMVASANDESEAFLSVNLGSVTESFVNSKGATFGALATSNSFAFAGAEGVSLNNGGTLIALARANSEAHTSVFFESGTNSGTIVAKAGGLDGGFSNAILRLDVGELNNTSGTIFASATGGGSAIVDITGSEIFGGLLKTTVGTGSLPGRPQAWIGVFGSGGSRFVSGPEITSPITAAALVESATIQANIGAFGSGAFLALIDDTIKSGTTIEAASGGSVFIEEDFTISAGVTIQALNSGGFNFDTEVTILGGSSVINNGSVKALNLVTASGGSFNLASVFVEASSVTNNATMLAANSGGILNSAFVIVETDTFTNKGSFKAVNSGGFANQAFAFAFAEGSATNSGTIAAIDSGGTDNLTSVFVEGGSSFTNAASGIVQAVVSGGTSGGTGNTASAFVEGGSSLTNNGSMVASANGGQGHLFQSSSRNFASLIVETLDRGATLTNNKTILGAATSGGSTFVAVVAEGGSVVNKGVISGSANSGSISFLDIFGSSVVNSKTIAAQASVFSLVSVFIGGSSITNAVSGSVFAGATSGSSAFLDIEFGSDGTFTNSGSVTVSASASSIGELTIRGGTVTNTKTIQVVANGQSHVFGEILADTINNSGLMAASAGADSTAALFISGFVNNKGGKIVASGVAEVAFDSGTTVSGGTLATTGSGFLFVGGQFFSSGHAPTSVTVEGATITSGSTFLVEGFVSGGATVGSAVLTLSGGDTIGKGAVVEAESGGIVSVTGTVTNSGGTFLALTSGIVDFTSTSNVNGNGVAVVQNGIVEIDGGGTETVDFTATGSGGLDLTSGNLYQGIVSGFGGPSHQNTAQFIDFRDVPFVSGTTSAVYVADGAHPTQSGTLEILNGTAVEATVELAGNYTNTVFNVTDDGSGGVKVTDPPGVTSGGTTTVTGNSPAGGTVVNSANPALFGNYIASMFATSAFNGGTLLSDLQTALQPQLAPSHH